MIDLSSNKQLLLLLNKYNLTGEEQEELLSIIEPIYIHKEFQRRLTNEFSHHDTITLGEHIIEVTITSYILAKKYSKKKSINLDLCLKIAMFHDLYTEAWQNNLNPSKKFFNKHGFRHPIEAVININNWFPEYFESEENSKIIIDGIVHHMFPLPVRRFVDSDENLLELKNYEYIKNMVEINKQVLIDSSNRFRIGQISFTPSAYIEGRIVSKADKIVSIKNIRQSNFKGVTALVTGKNKTLEKRRNKN